MTPCDLCEMAEYCNELGRCCFKDVDTGDGEITDVEEVVEPQLKRQKQTKVPEKLTPAHREFLRDILNF